MARIRSIKPDAFRSDSLSSVPRGVRWTFAGLWTYADDSGRGRDDVRLIKAELYPLDDEVSLATVAEDLDQLTAIGSVCRYEAGGKRYLHIPQWDHQKISHPTKSKIPACSIHSPEASGAAPEEIRKPPESLRPDREQGTGKGIGKKTRSQSSRPIPPDWKPKGSHRERAKKLELDLDEQAKRFREYFEETGDKHKSWDLTFTNWLRRTAQWGDVGPNAPAASPTRPNTGPRDYVPREAPDHIDPDDAEAYAKWLRGHPG